MPNNGFDVAPATRIMIARSVIDTMLARASRMVNVSESREGHVAVILADTFRVNMLAIAAALEGETRTERLAIDDVGAARVAEILHAGQRTVTITLPADVIEQARQLYLDAAMAGKDIEAHADPNHFEVPQPQYRAVAAAAMMLGEILHRAAQPTTKDEGNDAG